MFSSSFWFLFVMLFLVFLSSGEMRRRLHSFRLRRNKRNGGKMALPVFIKELVGQEVCITTINGGATGKIIEIQDDWIKLEECKKKKNILFIRDDMVVEIKVIKPKGE